MGYLYKLIAKEIWQLNPYIELHFSSNPVIWLVIKAYVYYKGEPMTYAVYIFNRPKHINTVFIVHVAHKIVNAVNQKMLNRKDF